MTRPAERLADAGLRFITPLLFCAAISLPARSLAAEPTPADKALAEALFRDGKALMEAGRARVACAKLAESQRLDPKLGTLLNLAACHEKEGRTASAWAEFTEAASVASKTDQDERAEFAKTHATELERRLSRLSILVASPLAKMQIALNERALSVAAAGSSVPLDPGEYAIKVTAPGKEAWSASVTIEPGPSTKQLMIPELKDDAPPAPQKKASPPPSSGEGLPPLFVAGMITAGAGLVGVGVGAVFGVRTLSKEADVEENCKGAVCNQEGLEANDAAYASATVSTVAFSAGLALASAGVVMMIFSRPRSAAPKKDARSVWVMPSAGPGGGRVTLGGQW